MMQPPVPSIDAIRPNDLMDQAALSPDALGALAERFNQMMQASPTVPSDQDMVHGPSAVSEVIGVHETAMQRVFEDARMLAKHSASMSPHELSAKGVDLTLQISVLNMEFMACTSMVHSAKNSLQTLMKNQ